MATKYTIRYYVKDVEKYNTTVTTENIHDDVWDIISDVVAAVCPKDNMQTPNQVYATRMYDSVEFDETGFSAADDGTMITATRE
jgi:hypothetical protein